MSKRAKRKGREPLLTRNKLRELLAYKKKTGLSNVEVAKHFEIGVNTIYNTVTRYKSKKRRARKTTVKKGFDSPRKQAEVTQ